MTLKIIHKNNTSAGQAPVPSDLDIGEIAVNSADAELYTKDTNGNIRKFQNTTTGSADGVQFIQAGASAVQRTIESKLQDVVSVKDFGAVGDGVTDDTAAIQAAIDYAGTLTGRYNFSGPGVGVFFPAGTYLVTSGLTIARDQGGIGLYGTPSRGSKIITPADVDDLTVLTIGEAGGYCYGFAIRDLTFSNGNLTSTNVNGIRYLDVNEHSMFNCMFREFNISLDGARMGTGQIIDSNFDTDQRTTAVEAHIRLDGNATGTGGGISIIGCNFNGKGGLTEKALKVSTVDGLYISSCHTSLCNIHLSLEPKDSGTSRVVTGVRVTNTYFDNAYSGSTFVSMVGTLRDGSKFQDIIFGDCVFRNGAGSSAGDHAVKISLTDTPGNPFNRLIKNISFDHCHFEQSDKTAIFAEGASAGKINVDDLKITSSIFRDNNYLGGATFSSCVTCEVNRLIFSNNIIGEDINPSTYALAFSPSESVNVVGNNFSSSNAATKVLYLPGWTGSLPYSIANNTYPTGAPPEWFDFTMTLTGGTSTTPAPTVSGSFIKQGNIVYVSVDLSFSAIDLDGTSIIVSGLPFVNNGPNLSVPVGQLSRANFTSTSNQYYLVANGTSIMRLRETAPNSATSVDVSSQSGTHSPTFGRLSFFYFTDF